MSSFLRDIFFGIRMLRKSPGFTLVAVLSLAVGIGVNSTVFGFVNAIFFKSIPVANKEGLVYVFTGDSRNPYRSTSYADYQELKQQNDVLSGLAAFASPPLLMTTGEHTEEVNAEVVSENYFSVLDVQMHRGQSFAPVDNQSTSDPRVVISEHFWQRRFNSDPNILGQHLILNGNSFSVIGVAPASYTGPDPATSTDLWIPIEQWVTILQNVDTTAARLQSSQANANDVATNPAERTHNRLGRDHAWLQMIGRLKPHVSMDQAEAALSVIASRLPVTSRENKEPFKAALSPASAVNPQISEEMPVGIMILAVTSLVLLICCVNVASLMLARAAARQKEFAVRIALGSSRGRLVRQLLTEALLLSLTGGVLGFVFAYWSTRAVLGFLPPGEVGLSADVAIDQRVLWFSLFISVLTALLFGLLPALNTFRLDLVPALGSEAMSLATGRKRFKLRRALVVIQIVTSLVLLIANGLFLRSFQNGQVVSNSFGTDRILLLNLSPHKYGFTVKYNKTFYRELLARIRETPGVESVTLSSLVPLTIEQSYSTVSAEGKNIRLQRSTVGESYFQTLRIPLSRGRDFERTDDESSHRVAIINEAMARTYWPNENPLGKVIQTHDGPQEIIGIAKDSPYNGFGNAAEPFLYTCVYQNLDENVSMIVRTSVEPATMIPAVKREVQQLGGNLPIFDFKTLAEVSQAQMTAVKAAVALLGLLSGLGLLVAAIGIYGVTSYAFSQRKREIGIRMSLGAQRSDILRLIMREGVILSVIGITVGMALALGTTHLISSVLYGVSPVDPMVFIGVALILGVVAIGASLVPSLLAAKTNPVDALRHE